MQTVTYLTKAFTLQGNGCHNLDPFIRTYDLHKLSDTQSILIYHSVVKVKRITVLSVSKLSFKVAFAYMLPQSSDTNLFTKSNDMLNSARPIRSKQAGATKGQVMP